MLGWWGEKRRNKIIWGIKVFTEVWGRVLKNKQGIMQYLVIVKIESYFSL